MSDTTTTDSQAENGDKEINWFMKLLLLLVLVVICDGGEPNTRRPLMQMLECKMTKPLERQCLLCSTKMPEIPKNKNVWPHVGQAHGDPT